jgi:hypothetical protein
MRKLFTPALLSITMLSACTEAPPEPPPFRAVINTQQLMAAIVDPATDVVWGAVGTIVSEEGVEEIFPRTEQEWLVVQNAAMVMMESGNLMMIGERSQEGEWNQMSRDLIEVGERALVAAVSQDPDAVFSLGGEIYEVCTRCHETYWEENADRVGPDPGEALEQAR